MNVKLFLQRLLPQQALTKLSGMLANSRWPFLKNALIAFYIYLYQPNLEEAVISDPKQYASFNDFFIRPLKPQLRPIASTASAIVAPVDGTLYQYGTIGSDTFFSAKGFEFTLENLLAGQKDFINACVHGQMLCMYLAPADYHRVHMPMAGRLQKMVYVPGTLFSVAPAVVENISGIFSRNERLLCIFDTAIGPMIVVLIGAMIVASIHTVWAGEINTEGKNQLQITDYRQEHIALKKGEELGHFQMGSTVMILFPKNSILWDPTLKTNHHYNYGTAIASVTTNPLGSSDDGVY